MVRLAQLVRASDCGSEGRGFETHISPLRSGSGNPLPDFILGPIPYAGIESGMLKQVKIIRLIYKNRKPICSFRFFVIILRVNQSTGLQASPLFNLPIMERTEISEQQYHRLLDAILNIVLKKGLSHTTMDHVASCLGMSKRTLYEIFDSKDDMLREMLDYQFHLTSQKAEDILRHSSNKMEALARIISLHHDFLTTANPLFFQDMDERFKHLRPDYDQRNTKMDRYLGVLIRAGINEGMFRRNCDYDLQLRLLRVQIESIKRMQDYFPPEITVAQAYIAIGQGFLRSIATPEGLKVLDGLEVYKKQ